MEVTYNRGESSKGTSSKDYTENYHVIQQFCFWTDPESRESTGYLYTTFRAAGFTGVKGGSRELPWWSSG